MEKKVDQKKLSWDPAHLRKIREHPCYSENARHLYGRMHLSVAPKCNVQCKFCLRRYDCVNESRPGVTSRVLTPREALEKVKEVTAKFPNIKVIGIAGPGDPLYNPETFETLKLVKKYFPHFKTCLSTNGLLLPEKLPLLLELKVETLTVTVNAVDPSIGEKIYSFIKWEGKSIRGRKAVEILLSNQLAGIKEAVEKGVVVKVNSVLIPTINEEHLIKVAQKMRDLGVYMMNIIPLIPQAQFAHLPAPTSEERKKIQDEGEKIIKQMRHCRQCRADAIGLLEEDLAPTFYTCQLGKRIS